MQLPAGDTIETLLPPGDVAALCRQHRVETLFLFGSATGGRFDPRRSDFDFLVTFEEMLPPEYADNYLTFANALEQLSGRPVHLVTERSIRNPYFRKSVLASRQLLYDRRKQEAVV